MGTNSRANRAVSLGNGNGGKSSRLAGLGGNKSKGDPRWTDVDLNILVQAIGCVTAAGGLISLGRTSDGGALSLFVKDGNETLRLYGDGPEEIEPVLVKLAERFSE